MTRHYPDLGSASDWLNQISHAARPIRSTTHIWVVTRHQYGISKHVSQTSFGVETSGSVAKCRLFCQATSSLVFSCFRLLTKEEEEEEEEYHSVVFLFIAKIQPRKQFTFKQSHSFY